MSKSFIKIPKPLGYIFFTAIIVLGIIQLFGFSEAEEAPNDLILSKNNPNTIIQPYIPQNLTFCGNNIPVNYFDVKESLDRELIVNTYWHSNTSLIIKRSKRFFPIIDTILERFNIPNDFKYLAVIESSLQNVTSPSNAKGYWQFLEGTGKEYGLTINREVDERLHIEKSTIAACKYLKKAYDRFNDWFLVAASYNMGMNGLAKEIESQKVNSYFDLELNSETARYVYRILAMKQILENPVKYNFNIKNTQKYSPYKYKIIGIDSSISDLTAFAITQNSNIKILRKLNPWLISNSLSNLPNKLYEIKLPVEDTRTNTFGD